jgi:uncharacterized membrane protein (UPF0182 family)
VFFTTLVRDQEVDGSNPFAPTILIPALSNIYPATSTELMLRIHRRIVALQDGLAYGPTFESAMATLFGGAVSSMSAAAVPAEQLRRPASATSPQPAADLNALIAEAAKDLADYQRLSRRRQARRGRTEA